MIIQNIKKEQQKTYNLQLQGCPTPLRQQAKEPQYT